MFLLVGVPAFVVSTLLVLCCSQSKWIRRLQGRLGVSRPFDRSSWLLLGGWFVVWSILWMPVAWGSESVLEMRWFPYVLFGMCVALLPVLLLVGGGLFLKAGLACAAGAATFVLFFFYAACLLPLKRSGQGLEIIFVILMVMLMLGIAAAFVVVGLFHRLGSSASRAR